MRCTYLLATSMSQSSSCTDPLYDLPLADLPSRRAVLKQERRRRHAQVQRYNFKRYNRASFPPSYGYYLVRRLTRRPTFKIIPAARTTHRLLDINLREARLGRRIDVCSCLPYYYSEVVLQHIAAPSDSSRTDTLCRAAQTVRFSHKMLAGGYINTSN